MSQMMSTREVARFLNINEKLVYTLVSEKALPATKVTGKWLFPKHLVEQWVESHCINYPDNRIRLPPYDGLLIITGSADPLLNKTIYHYNRIQSGHIAVFGNLGSMGGVQALRQNRCHIAASHLLQEDEKDYNFDYASRELDTFPAIVNFCQREQGIILQKGNPHKINSVADLAKPGLRLINRALGAGTRLLLDRELKKANVIAEKIDGYAHEVSSHTALGLEILAGRADVGPGIRAAAEMFSLDFMPLRWERYDLMTVKDRFFDEGIQRFLGMLHEDAFKQLAAEMTGYDLNLSGKMVFPNRKKS